MEKNFKIGEYVFHLDTMKERIEKVKVVSYREDLLEDDSIDVSYRVESEDGNKIYTSENYLDETQIELANKLLETYGFSKELRFRPVCEKCTRLMTETYSPL